MMDTRLRRADWLHAAVVAVALFAVYAATAPRTVALEDDGSFILSSYFLGPDHPPGYPLFVLAAKLFTWLPIGSVAYRVHLASAAFGALSCAALWLCARVVTGQTVAAYLAGLGLGLSRTFWSQAIIAEVYTLNVLFLFVLLILALRASTEERNARRTLMAMALVFGLSLANHWPLMLLVAPAFVILLWPRVAEIIRWSPALCGLFLLGLTPYVWMVIRSWGDLPISFFGPLESADEIRKFVTRATYASVDVSPTATWIDRLKYFRFLGSEVLLQFAILGTAVAAVGFVVQWRVWGKRLSSALTVAFLMPSAVLLLLLKFDYEQLSKYVFQVYPLPSYGVAALWMGLGFTHLAGRFSVRARPAAGAAAVLLALIAWLSAGPNLRADYDWSARYARAVLTSLPPDAILFVASDIDVGTIGYLHLIEGMRPDVTLYNPAGVALGTRLFHPLRTSSEEMHAAIRRLVRESDRPVAFPRAFPTGYGYTQRWLYVLVDKASDDPTHRRFELPDELRQFLEGSVLTGHETDTWTVYFRAELRRQIGAQLALAYRPGNVADPADPRTLRYLEALSGDFNGVLGLAHGLFASDWSRARVLAERYVAQATALMPDEPTKGELALYFELKAYARLEKGDQRGAIEDLETSVSLLPRESNTAIPVLADLYAKTNQVEARNGLKARFGR